MRKLFDMMHSITLLQIVHQYILASQSIQQENCIDTGNLLTSCQVHAVGSK